MKLILAAAAAIFTFASCSNNDMDHGGSSMPTMPANDGGVYSDK